VSFICKTEDDFLETKIVLTGLETRQILTQLRICDQ